MTIWLRHSSVLSLKVPFPPHIDVGVPVVPPQPVTGFGVASIPILFMGLQQLLDFQEEDLECLKKLIF